MKLAHSVKSCFLLTALTDSWIYWISFLLRLWNEILIKLPLHSKWVSSVNNKFCDETFISRQPIWKAMLFWWDMEWVCTVVIFVNYKRNKIGLLLQFWDNIVTESKTLFSCVWPATLPQAALHFRTLMGNKPFNILTNSFEISGAKSKMLL